MGGRSERAHKREEDKGECSAPHFLLSPFTGEEVREEIRFMFPGGVRIYKSGTRGYKWILAGFVFTKNATKGYKWP